MNKCWFILEQSFFTPPKYARPSKAFGKAEGPLRLGDVVPSPNNLYPILTQGPLPLFSADMRITTTKLGDFSWNTSSGKEVEGAIGAGAPIAQVAGATVNAELNATFTRTMENWAQFRTIDSEIVQPSTSYINEILEKEGVKDHMELHKIPLLDRWTVYVVTGLMIARAGGEIGSLVSSSTAFSGGPDVEIPGVATAKLTTSNSNNTQTTKSAEIKGDRIWAVRFAKVHKGLLRPRWRQTEVTVGAALDGSGEEEEKVSEVLEQEGITGFTIVEARTDRDDIVFVTGVDTGQRSEACGVQTLA